MPIKSIALAATLLVAASIPSLAGTISVLPSTSTVSAGSTFTLTVQITGAADLYGYQFDIGFNPGVLAATSVSEGSFLSSGGATTFFAGTADNIGGTIANNADILDGAIAGVNGDGTLLSMTFQALMSGSSTITLFNLTALNSVGQGIPETIVNSAVTVLPAAASPVPEPGTGLLLATAMLSLIALRNRNLIRRACLSNSRARSF